MRVSPLRAVEDDQGIVQTLCLWLEEPISPTAAASLCIRLEAAGGYRDLPALPGDADPFLT